MNNTYIIDLDKETEDKIKEFLQVDKISSSDIKFLIGEILETYYN